MRFENDHGALVFYHQREKVRIEAWGQDSFRVRSTMLSGFTGKEWALTEEAAKCNTEVTIEEEDHWGGDGTLSRESRCLKVINREWKGIIGGSEYSLNLKFESNDGEKIFGMGQYQQNCMELKGCVLELAQRNSQISVPFAVSSLGYGFLWNNPAVGRVTFGKNYYEWIAQATKEMD